MKPAARTGDAHTCPMAMEVFPFLPHVGGTIVGPGEPTVLVEGKPNARYTELAACAISASNAVNEGAPTVLVGRLPAGRHGDATHHGGNVVAGGTVLVGDPPPGVAVVRRGNVILIVNRNVHRILIVGVQEFSGDGASEAYAERAAAAINAAWSRTTPIGGETYQVECMITCRPRGEHAKNPAVNEINVVQTSDPPSVTSDKDPSNQPFYGKEPGYQHSTDTDLTIAHEFGHAMGLLDEYSETKGPDGKRRTIPRRPGDLMADVSPGSKPSQDNYESLVTGKGLR